MFTPPVSPLEAKYTTPLFWKWESLVASLENSLPPQLMDTSPRPPLARTWLVATSTAANRFAKLLVAASTSTILAFGAIACAHSMSSADSCAHPQLPRGRTPFAKTTWNTDPVPSSVGRPNFEENVLKSLTAVG